MNLFYSNNIDNDKGQISLTDQENSIHWEGKILYHANLLNPKVFVLSLIHI